MVLVWFVSEADGAAQPLVVTLTPSLIIGVPLALAVGVIAARIARVAHGPDLPARLLSVTTAGLSGRDREWGQAMRAELESVDAPMARRRFAWGCSFASLALGVTRQHVSLAVATGAVIALATLTMSRLMLDGSRVGLMGFSLWIPQLVIFGVAVYAARTDRSFRSGIVCGILALIVSLVLMLAVEVHEAGRWYDTAGVHLLDGDPPRPGSSRASILLDPLAPSFVILHLLLWAAWPVLGAAAGAFRRRQPRASLPALFISDV
jgi:hypothetical protein